jgi:hypothetical protein
MASRDVDFVTFFIVWARIQGWTVPLLHVRICVWLDTCLEPERVLMVFRGAAKSTIYAVFKAYRLYKDRTHRSLVWSADGPTAGMLTADVINVLRNHPLTRGMLPPRPGAKRFWVTGARDARNASMRAVGVNTNATGARADAVDFDDIEVPGNIETPEARLKLRQRISESTHIAVPGAQHTYIGTPHAHDSIYPERIAAGAAVLKIPLFEHTVRFRDTDKRTRYPFGFPVGCDGLCVMAGIHTGARLLVDGIDYRVEGSEVVFARPPGVVLDICAGCAWPVRFTRAEIELRRKNTRTLNAWDSQYQLDAKPLTETRLDPEKIPLYDVEPHFDHANKVLRFWLGQARIVGATLRWDPSAAKLKSDASALALMFQDEQGRRYWHRAIALTGEVAELNERADKVTGGQVFEICDVVEKFGIRRITVETNGVGAFAPMVLRMALKQRNLQCAVIEVHAEQNKNKRILEAFEPLISSRMVWAHVSVADGPAFEQMKDWKPELRDQADDHLDAASGAAVDQPERVGIETMRNRITTPRDDWRPGAGVFEAELEL